MTGPTPQRLLAQAAQLGVAARAKPLPDLSRLTRLTALNLADNNLLEVPPCLLMLTGLQVLDLSGEMLRSATPGASLHAKPYAGLLESCFPSLLCAISAAVPTAYLSPPVPLLCMPCPAPCAGNLFMEVAQPLTQLAAFSQLRWLDMRSVHMEDETKYWSPAKCATMQHVSALAKSLRRKNRHIRVLHDTS